MASPCRWRDEGPSCKHLLDCEDKVGIHPHFRYICPASCCDERRHLSNMHQTEEDYLCIAPLGSKAPCHFGPIQNRHRNIPNENIWHELVCGFQSCLSVCDARD